MAQRIRKPTLCQTVLDCPDPTSLAEFYASLLGLSLGSEDGASQAADEEKDWVVLKTSEGRPLLAFQRVESLEPPTWPAGSTPQQLHLDLSVHSVDELEDQHQRVLALGGSLLSDQKNVGPDEPFRVYRDPAGHPFCIFVAGQ